MFNIVVSVSLVAIVIASLAAWYNTHTISRDLAEIKEKLGISDVEVKQSSFFDRDFDRD